MSTLNKQQRSTKKRTYTLRKRAEQMAETRLRITVAAVRLHTTVGPANTTISDVAEEAGVTRVTLYRHFADEAELFLACSSHWWSLHPGPDPGEWAKIGDLSDRASRALTELYAFYREHHTELFPIYRDFESMPEAVQAMLAGEAGAMVEALVTRSGIRGSRRRRLVAVAGLATGFWTWWSLAIDGGLADDEIVDLMVRLITSV